MYTIGRGRSIPKATARPGDTASGGFEPTYVPSGVNGLPTIDFDASQYGGPGHELRSAAIVAQPARRCLAVSTIHPRFASSVLLFLATQLVPRSL